MNHICLLHRFLQVLQDGGTKTKYVEISEDLETGVYRGSLLLRTVSDIATFPNCSYSVVLLLHLIFSFTKQVIKLIKDSNHNFLPNRETPSDSADTRICGAVRSVLLVHF